MNWPVAFTYLWMVAAWVFGIAVAKGFWMTFAAVILPPLAWILLAEELLRRL